jgi:N-acetylglucosaminyldiphosphoundecaprenol N-acetyl-beta-D-mannosaminyltransferase
MPAEQTGARLDGIPIRETTPKQAVSDFLDAARAETGQAYRFLNAYSIALADRDAQYHRLLADRGVNLADGMPLAFMLRRLGNPELVQIRGPAFFADCLDAGRALGIRHFFLGGSPAMLERLVAEICTRFPGVVVAGVESPPFRPLTPDELREQDSRLVAAEPDLVWVGLGTPKQDFEAQRISDDLGLCAAGVGAAFDFMAGVKRQAPPWLSKVGLEWLFRLLTEPRRLWKRYLFGNSRFLRVSVRELVRIR